MSWLNFDSVKDNVSSLTGQISSFTREVLTEGTEEVYDHEVELKIAKTKVNDLENRLTSQKIEWEKCCKRNEELQEKAESSDLQIRSLTADYRQRINDKDKTIKDLEQSFSELQRNSFSRTRNDSSSKDNTDVEDLEFLQHQLANLKHKLASVEAECQHWKNAASGNNSEAQLQHMQETHRQEIASLQDVQSQKMLAVKKKHRADMEALQDEKADLENQVKELQEFNSSWDDTEAGMDGAAHEQLRRELSEKNVMLMELQEKHDKAFNDCQVAKDNCLELDVELEATQNKLDELEASNEELRLSIVRLETTLASEMAARQDGEEKLNQYVDGGCVCTDKRSSSTSTTDSKEGGFVKVHHADHQQDAIPQQDVGCQATLVQTEELMQQLENTKDENVSLWLELNKMRDDTKTGDGAADELESVSPSTDTRADGSNSMELNQLRQEIDRLATCTTELLEELDYSKETQHEQAIELDSLRQICLIEGEPFEELQRLQLALTELGDRYADLLHYYRQNNTSLLRREVSSTRAKLLELTDVALEGHHSECNHLDAAIHCVASDVALHRDDIVSALEERSHECTQELLVSCTSDTTYQVVDDDHAIVASLRAEKAILERTIEGLERKTETLEAFVSGMQDSNMETASPDQERTAHTQRKSFSPECMSDGDCSNEGLAFDDDEQNTCDTQWHEEQSRIEELEDTLQRYETELKENEAVRLDWEVEKHALEAAVIELQRKCKESRDAVPAENHTATMDMATLTEVDAKEWDVMAATLETCANNEGLCVDRLANMLLQCDTMMRELSTVDADSFSIIATENSGLIVRLDRMDAALALLTDTIVSSVNSTRLREEALAEQCLRVSGENQHLTDTLTDASEEFDRVNRETAMANDRAARSNAEAETYRTAVAEMEADLQQTREELSAARWKLTMLTDRLTSAEDDIQVMTESSDALQQEAEAMQQSNEALTREKEQMQLELDKLQFQMDTNETDDSSEISEMKAQLSEMKSERENLIAMVNERDCSIMELQDRYDTVVADMEQDQGGDVSLQEGPNDALFKEEKSARQQAERNLGEREAELSALREKVDSLSISVSSVATEHSRVADVDTTTDVTERESFDALFTENMSLRMRLGDMEELLIGIDTCNESVFDTRSTVEPVELQGEVNRLTEIIQVKDQQLINLQQMPRDAIEEVPRSDDAIASRLRDSEQQLSFMEEKTTSMEEMVKHYSVQVDLLKEERQTALRMLDNKADELADLNERLESVSSRAEAKDHASSVLHSEHQRLLELNRTQGEEIARLREKIHHLQVVVEGRQAEHGSRQHMMVEHDNLIAQINALQEEEMRVLSVVHEKDVTIKTATEKGVILEGQLREAVSEIRRLEAMLREVKISVDQREKHQRNEVDTASLADEPNIVASQEHAVLATSSSQSDLVVATVEEAVESKPCEGASTDTPMGPSIEMEEMLMLKQRIDSLATDLVKEQKSHQADVLGLRQVFDGTTRSKDHTIAALEERLHRAEENCASLTESLQENGISTERIHALTQEIDDANNKLIAREEELSAHMKTNEKLRSVVAAGENALAKMQEDNRQLTQECQRKDESLLLLQTTCTKHEQQLRENETELHRLKVALLEVEAKAAQETQRLRNHLLEIEEGYTAEVIAAQQREEKLQELCNTRTAELSRTTALLEQTSQHSHSGMQSLEEQLHVIASQRDNALLQLSKAEDKAEETVASLGNLQFALEQLQKDKDGQYDMLNEQHTKLLANVKKDQEAMQRKEKECQARLQEAALAVQGATNLTADFKSKDAMITSLREQIQFLKQDSSTKEELLRRLKDSSEGQVDKPLIKNLLLGYFHAQEAKRRDVVRVIGSLVGLSPEEIRMIGSGAPPSAMTGGWVSGLLSLGGAEKARRPSLSNDSHVDIHGQSFSEMFVNFLEQESFSSGLATGAKRSNALIGAAMETPRAASTPAKPSILSTGWHANEARTAYAKHEPRMPMTTTGLTTTSNSASGAMLFPAPGQEIPRVHTSTANSALQSMLS